MKTDYLIMIGGIVALSASAAISALFFTVPLWAQDRSWTTAGALLGSMALVGILPAGAVIWSARHEGRWGWLGLLLGLAYLGLPYVHPLFILHVHWYGPPALFVIVLAALNLLKELSTKRCSFSR